MGGEPISVLNIVGFPSRNLPLDILADILRGGLEKIRESGAALAGGHTVTDHEIKYGLAVTGRIDPARIVSNAGARAGDRLVLTKPLGMGAVSTAIGLGKIDDAAIEAASRQMAELNRRACDAMLRHGAHAATDITGFGLLGHGFELASASGISLRIRAASVPFFPGAEALAKKKILSGGAARTRAYLGERVRIAGDVPPERASLCFDAETSGGLLISVPPEGARAIVEELGPPAAEIGEVIEKAGEVAIDLVG